MIILQLLLDGPALPEFVGDWVLGLTLTLPEVLNFTTEAFRITKDLGLSDKYGKNSTFLLCIIVGASMHV
jgi:hypothetical protein